MTISKTDYLVWRDCAKNAWVKKHKPEIYFAHELSEFDKLIINTGNEVDVLARDLFPGGVLIEGRDEEAQEATAKALGAGARVIYQPVFMNENFLAACDILTYDKETDSYAIYEVKASNDIEKKEKRTTFIHDLAFQTNLLRMCGCNVTKTYLVHMNADYRRQGDVDLAKLFAVDDVTEEVEGIAPGVLAEMEEAYAFLTQKEEPTGNCKCFFTRGRSGHCTTFAHSNPEAVGYTVHDLNRIGQSKKKLKELIERDILYVKDIPANFDLNDAQRNQVDAYQEDRILIKHENIQEELSALEYPLYFLDYESFPPAVPRFDGYGPYKQIPFQYSLHIIHEEGGEPEHREFLYTGSDDPGPHVAEALARDIGPTGSVIAWYKTFERDRTRELAERYPQFSEHMHSIVERLYDLMDPFQKQMYVHKDFKGSASIKKVLPVLVPELSYKTLGIQEGGTASESWNKVVLGLVDDEEKARIERDLKIYCGLDSYAMVAIYSVLKNL